MEPSGAENTDSVARQASSFGTAAAAYAEHRPGYAEAAVHWALSPVRDRRPVRVLDLAAGTGSGLFETPEVAEFENGQRRTADSLLATLATHSSFLVMEEPERTRLLAEVRDFLHARPEAGTGEFVFPLVTAVLRITRK